MLVVRFEDRKAGIERISDFLQMPELGTLHLQRATSENESSRKHYNDETKAIIERVFKKDIEVFGYEF